MSKYLAQLEDLSRRAQAGDAAAVAQLDAEMRPAMKVVVRRALAAKSDALLLTRHIRAQAAKLSSTPRGSTLPPREGLLQRVAQAFGQAILKRLRAGWAPTIRLHDTLNA